MENIHWDILVHIKDMRVRNFVVRSISPQKKPIWGDLADFRDGKVRGDAEVCPGFQQVRQKVA
jgi:hypothetical protein